MRKLASIKTINNIQPIENADRIELASVGGWGVVVAKNVNHSVGDKVVYCEIDSFLPIEPEFEFLRKTSYKKMSGGSEGFRLKSIHMRGTLSQGLIIPLQDAIDIIKRKNGEVDSEMIQLGNDVTELLGIKKYEKPIPPQLEGVKRGDFPSFLIKTDAERIQNLTDDYSYFNESEWERTEKLDGASATFYLHDNIFGVCSRNIDLEESNTNTYWKVAKELNIEEKLRDYFGMTPVGIQGEIIGEGIQKNIYGIKGHTIRIFGGVDIITKKQISPRVLKILCSHIDLEYVPVIDSNISLSISSPSDIKKLIELADGKSQLNENTNREGLVYQSLDGSKKFKTISNSFLT